MDILQRYSDRATPDLRQIVRGISDGGQALFRTPVLRSRDNAMEYWLQAWKNPQTNLWMVDRHTRLLVNEGGKQETVPRRTERMMNAACFFDALHGCSQFTHQETMLGATALPWEEDEEASLPGFRQAAATAFQPVDLHGAVHPAAFGNILTPGDFDENQFALAAKTAKQELAQVDGAAMQKSFLDGIIGAGPAGEINREKAIADNIERQRLITIFEAVSTAARDAVGAIATVRKNEFRPEGFLRKNTLPHPSFGGNGYTPMYNTTRLAWGTVLTAGLKPAIGYLRGTSWYTMDRFVQKSFRKLENLTAQLSDMPEKKLAEDFTRAARAAYRLEHAALIHQQAKSGTLPRRQFEKGLKLIARAAAEGCLSAADAGKLESDYLNNAFPVPDSFESRLRYYMPHSRDKGLLGDLLTAIDKKIASLKNNILAP